MPFWRSLGNFDSTREFMLAIVLSSNLQIVEKNYEEDYHSCGEMDEQMLVNVGRAFISWGRYGFVIALRALV